MLDSFGVGAEPDADKFGDVGANTLASIAKSEKFHTPNMRKMGLFNLDGVTCGEPAAQVLGSCARLQEASNGKDTTIGHWEIAGVEEASALCPPTRTASPRRSSRSLKSAPAAR